MKLEVLNDSWIGKRLRLLPGKEYPEFILTQSAVKLFEMVENVCKEVKWIANLSVSNTIYVFVLFCFVLFLLYRRRRKPPQSKAHI
jgi:hypothetical protein